MKKVFLMMTATALALAMTACGGSGNEAPEPSAAPTASPVATATPAQTEAPSESVTSEEQEAASGAADNMDGWRQFLADYEAWANSYIEMIEKYKEDPSNATILSEYTKMMQQAAEWAENADSYQSELVASPEALAEYCEMLTRIMERIAEASN